MRPRPLAASWLHAARTLGRAGPLGLAFLLSMGVGIGATEERDELGNLSAARHRLVVGPAGAFTTVYANAPLEVRAERIRRVVIMVHGAGRDGDEYFRTAMAAAYLSGALGDTLVISPRFAAASDECRDDDVAQGELTWTCDSWKFGEASTRNGAVGADSFQVMDRLMAVVTDQRLFPNVEGIVLAGHSAGAQYVSRYAIANAVHDRLRVRPTYVAANASSYAYVDRVRPLRTADTTRPGSQLTPQAAEAPARLAEVQDPKGCDGYNTWPYGLDAPRGYVAGIDPADVRRNFAARPLTLLAGQSDTTGLAGLDEACPAMMEGRNRLERAANYVRYGRERHAVEHPLRVIPLCGHNARCMFTSPLVMPLLFPARALSEARAAPPAR